METNENNIISWEDFSKIEMRTGTVLSAEVFKEANKPAYKLTVDFGKYGIRKTSAQITKLYMPEELIGQQVIAVLNFPPKQIANMMSECLILGAIGNDNEIILIQPEQKTKNGLKIG